MALQCCFSHGSIGANLCASAEIKLREGAQSLRGFERPRLFAHYPRFQHEQATACSTAGHLRTEAIDEREIPRHTDSHQRQRRRRPGDGPRVRRRHRLSDHAFDRDLRALRSIPGRRAAATSGASTRSSSSRRASIPPNRARLARRSPAASSCPTPRRARASCTASNRIT